MKQMKRLLLIGLEVHPDHEVVNGVHAYFASRAGWEFHLEMMNHPQLVERIELAIREWKADGVIAQVSKSDVKELLKKAKLPTVNVSYTMELSFPSVIADDIAVGKMAARHFMGNGFRHFGACALSGEVFSRFRCGGFVEEILRGGMQCAVLEDERRENWEVNWVKNRQRMDRWLQSLPKPVGIFCIYDYRAQEVALACQRLRLRVPDDVAIVGAGNTGSLCKMSNPPLSSVDLDLRTLGYEAARMVAGLIAGKRPPKRAKLIAPLRVVTRHSSDVVAVGDAMVSGAVRFIREHAREAISVKNVVDEAAGSRNTLERRFRKLVGHTPAEEIVRVRIEHATKLLRETHLPISAVARQSGYTDPRTFAISFRNRMRVTPTEYRRRGRGVKED